MSMDISKITDGCKTNPIHEVWANFQILLKHLAQPAYAVMAEEMVNGKPKNPVLVQGKAKRLADLATLRAVLLERCKEVWDGDESGGTVTRFEIIERDGKRFLRTKAVDIVRQTRIDDHDSALNMSASYAFWAWELKQRNSESNG